MNTKQKIVLDFGRNDMPVIVWAKQYDNDSRTIEIVPLNCGQEYKLESGITAQFRVKKHDKKTVVNPATISNGVIIVKLTNQILAAAGKATAEIALIKGAEILSTQTFIIDVEESAYNAEKVESSDEYKALTESLKNINNLSAAAESANNAAKKVEQIANGIDEKIDNALSGINITTEITSTIEGYNGYNTQPDILGLQVDYENKIYTRLAGAVGLEAGTDFDKFSMYGGRKRCNVSNNGEITAYYGDTNYSDTANGQVMVYQPKFYYKVVPLKLDKITDGIGYHIRKANYYISDTKKAGFKLHPAFYDENGNEVDYILYSAYEASLYDIQQKTYFKDGTMTDTDLTLSNYSVCSVAMEKPISGLYKSLTKTNFEKIASQRGKGWHCETIKTLSANQLLMMIELGTMNFQSAIGQGIVSITSVDNYNCSSFTGSTRGMGNATGTASWSTNEIGGTQTTYYSADTGKLAVTYRGVENLWGNIYKHINGINIWGDGAMLGGQPYVADDFNFSETKHDDNYKPVGFTLPNENGYIKAMGYGSEKYDWLLMPSEIGGNSSLPVGDYVNTTPNVSAHKAVLYGGMWSSASAAGGFTYYCSDGAGTKYKSYGGRIVYIPTAE